MSKYYLNAILNDETVLTITSGKLEEIDKFIIQNDIFNVEQLYEYIKDKINILSNDSCLNFSIVYNYNNEIKTKTLIFKHELKEFNKCDNKADYIYNLLIKNPNFKRVFDSKYINRILNGKNNKKILEYAYDYSINFNHNKFNKLYSALVSRKNVKNISEKRFNSSAQLEDALNERIYSYKLERDMYFDAYYYDKIIPESFIMISIDKEDEYEEEMKHDQNPDIYIHNYESNNETEVFELKKIKSKKKKKIINNPNQISLFSDENML